MVANRTALPAALKSASGHSLILSQSFRLLLSCLLEERMMIRLGLMPWLTSRPTSASMSFFSSA
jgi:hypothetical protein